MIRTAVTLLFGLAQFVIAQVALWHLYGVFVRIPGCFDNYCAPDQPLRVRLMSVLIGCGAVIIGGLLTYRLAGLRWKQAGVVVLIAAPMSFLALVFSMMPEHLVLTHLLALWSFIPLVLATLMTPIRVADR